jgi:hypothetical protein
LQKVGTKNAKRRLRQYAGRERHFQRDVNHCISKALVRKASYRARRWLLQTSAASETGQRFATNIATSGTPGPSISCARFSPTKPHGRAYWCIW